MKRLLVSISMALCCAIVAQAQMLYVPSPYSTIQSAVNDANDGDIVVVSAGTYQENIDFLGKAITVRSTDPNDPNIVDATIIDGSNPSDPNRGSTVTFKSGEDTNSALTGFTITGGSGSWELISWESKGLNWNRCGGGAVCYNMSAPTISKNIFVGNTAGQGGGVYIYGNPVNPNDPCNPPVHISPIITGNTFIDNLATIEHGFPPPNTSYPNNDHGDGGAIVGFQGCDAIITGNTITSNSADSYGGGIHLRQWSNGFIANNQITDNNSMLGAGIHITYTSSPTVKNNLIKTNTASSLGGGGIYVYYLSAPLIERNIIAQNTSSNGAGIGVYWESTPTIRNNLIYRNNAGAGMRIVSSSPLVANNTISDNYNGGITCEPNSNPVITNNIITSNGIGWGIRVNTGSSPVIKYNDIWNNAAGTTGPAIPDQTGINGNISTDPNFANHDANDYHLDANSPCINAGDPNYSPEPNETDYDGDNRIMFQRIDIGADEVGIILNATTGIRYETIQKAVDDSSPGDVIIVPPGTYTGTGNRDITFRGKAITVQSEDPNNWDIVAATIIDANGFDPQYHRSFHFYNGEGPNSVVAGLTMTRGGGVYDGGAIRCISHSSPTIRNCLITGNESGGRGTIYTENSSPIIFNCIITNNRASRGYGGAVCAFYNSSPTILNCIITGNKAEGAGHHGGGIYCHDHANAFIANCIIAGNTAGHRGGGIAAYWSAPTYLNCTVIGNRSLEGGGLSSFRESNPVVINCIVRDNIAPDGNQLALINTMRIWGVDIPTEMTVRYSDIEGGQTQATVDQHCTLHWGAGNIDIDPNFVDAGYWLDSNTPTEPNDDVFVIGNFHLLPGSGCINLGDNNSVPGFAGNDIDGEERIFSGAVDIGADEMVTNPFDFDGDGLVEFYELDILIDEWLQDIPELQTDFNEDGIVDFADFALLAEQWAWQAGWYY